MPAWGGCGAVAPICWTHLPNSVNLVKARRAADTGLLSKAARRAGRRAAVGGGGRWRGGANPRRRGPAGLGPCYTAGQADRSVGHGAARRAMSGDPAYPHRRGLIGNDTVKLTVLYNEYGTVVQ